LRRRAVAFGAPDGGLGERALRRGGKGLASKYDFHGRPHCSPPWEAHEAKWNFSPKLGR